MFENVNHCVSYLDTLFGHLLFERTSAGGREKKNTQTCPNKEHVVNKKYTMKTFYSDWVLTNLNHFLTTSRMPGKHQRVNRLLLIYTRSFNPSLRLSLLLVFFFLTLKLFRLQVFHDRRGLKVICPYTYSAEERDIPARVASCFTRNGLTGHMPQLVLRDDTYITYG